ncbi:MAG: MarR family winged helix-turn-helix transcriptional regulator [Neomegalonema sp.]|nr:MarR family winged helix-turn-helix transcriptional regulator [Neomegalonema sp.]
MNHLTAKERRAIRRLLAAIQEYRKLDPDMQLPMAASLLIVALKDGVSRTEVMEDLNVAGSTATRNLMGLMAEGRLGRPGHGLVSQRVNPDERRWRMHSLTPEGLEVVRRLAEIIEPSESGRPKPSDRRAVGAEDGDQPRKIAKRKAPPGAE